MLAFKTISQDGFAATSFRWNSLPAYTGFRRIEFIRNWQAAQGQRITLRGRRTGRCPLARATNRRYKIQVGRADFSLLVK